MYATPCFVKNPPIYAKTDKLFAAGRFPDKNVVRNYYLHHPYYVSCQFRPRLDITLIISAEECTLRV